MNNQKYGVVGFKVVVNEVFNGVLFLRKMLFLYRLFALVHFLKAGQVLMNCIRWPPRSPDLSYSGFFYSYESYKNLKQLFRFYLSSFLKDCHLFGRLANMQQIFQSKRNLMMKKLHFIKNSILTFDALKDRKSIYKIQGSLGVFFFIKMYFTVNDSYLKTQTRPHQTDRVELNRIRQNRLYQTFISASRL